jgi:predicted ribosome quality control (RQC) complex YloA/Tae2 family protein
VLGGCVVDRVAQLGFDRVLEIRFRSGDALVAELTPRSANLVRLDSERRVADSARPGGSPVGRLARGQAYAPPPSPPSRVAWGPLAGQVVDRMVAGARREGFDLVETIRRSVLGLDRTSAWLVAEECASSGRTPGDVLRDRVQALVEGRLDLVVLGPCEPDHAVEQGSWGEGRFHLLPWAPQRLPDGTRMFCRNDAAGTAGLYHASADRAEEIARRIEGLRAILGREQRRTLGARARVAADLVAFENPERYRHWGEALLAGLTQARRTGEHVVVPDPYDGTGLEIQVPVEPGQPLTEAAASCFRRYRRALRGRDVASRRAAALKTRSARLEELRARSEQARGQAALQGLEEAMRAAGMPIPLGPSRRTGAPRLEGVRVFTSRDGLAILVGRGARQNERLTFKLAAAEDFWFHAHGVPGAHVVVRNPGGRPSPPPATLREAAAAAAFYSGAREERSVEVRWTRRKYVRRCRGAPPGTVILKRSQSLRVRPAAPSGGPVGSGNGVAVLEDGPRRAGDGHERVGSGSDGR